MKKMVKASLLAALLASLSYATDYKVDPAHSNVGFMVKHLTIAKVYGSFKSYNADVDYDKDAKMLKTLDVTLDVNSVDTQNEKRDEHLKSEDFFKTSEFKDMKFKMTKFEKESDTEGKVMGDLTIRDVTKPVELKFELSGIAKDMDGKERIGFSLTGDVMRKDFKIGDKFPGAMVSDKVQIQIDVEAQAM
ncbi:putative periplasmic protein (YceI-like domain) [Campylobacter pinnipediorum subsp. caledonicus]|uniref:Putative periplasmic protein (YceI-like domain) n=1 Tax=Campylobacter pinnipediorum subsp. caledonicus TaxID=1874362 RepID=A0A1S6U5G2_9BACT|nr:YceI family protein [Campylobacter pinnipediorum]AQW85311.1 putative periplasmic protein (YceI-like domain) [Campylobacter pinnipediorum subsp. caledonicus]AQW86920.1 putative periplasmic protein (YceI-like domain) [Campylobacter pinnipediorum subsp. caledonicus]OPA71912.1 protein yceI precursor [Campylobacter pinnipediorum subsp. caledonicus]